MDNIIKQIIEIDKKASEKTENAKQKKIKELEILEIKKQEIINQWSEKNRNEIETIKNSYEIKLQEKIKMLEADTYRKISKLKKTYEEKHEYWEQEIFKKIIG